MNRLSNLVLLIKQSHIVMDNTKPHGQDPLLNSKKFNYEQIFMFSKGNCYLRRDKEWCECEATLSFQLRTHNFTEPGHRSNMGMEVKKNLCDLDDIGGFGDDMSWSRD